MFERRTIGELQHIHLTQLLSLTPLTLAEAIHRMSTFNEYAAWFHLNLKG